MLKKHKERQIKYEFVCIDNLVPKDHLLRKISKFIDFRFIHDKVKDLYCPDNGRPALDPVVMFKMLFIGYLFGIRSERRLVKEVEVNVAYRWFLGFTFETKVPDASTFSQNRRRRFNQSTVYQEIFDEIVLQAIRHKMVDGKVLYTDSTHLKASANKNKFIEQEVAKSTRDYLKKLDQDIEEDRKEHGKKPLPPGDSGTETRTVKVSTTDPDSGYLYREGKPKGFHYLDHRTVDGIHGIITDTHVTPGNVHDSIPYLGRLDRQRDRFEFEVDAVGLDAGYHTAAICKGLEERNIFGVIGYRRPNKIKGRFSKRAFTYDDSMDVYLCPGNCMLKYRTTNRNGFREYVSDPSICKHCEHLQRCTGSRNHVKVITRHIWEDSKEWSEQNRLSERGKAIYTRRKETVERSFADSKELQGHRYARMRGKSKVLEQCLLCAAVFNMKKIALHLSRLEGSGGPNSPKSVFGTLFLMIETLISAFRLQFKRMPAFG
jgi:transposase